MTPPQSESDEEYGVQPKKKRGGKKKASADPVFSAEESEENREIKPAKL